MNSVFALVDCNNFYVSCERLFKPELRGRPVVVLSNNDGCIIARSNEAKALGIAMGAPYFKTLPLIRRHKVEVFSSNYTLYGDISSRVMTVLQQLEPEVEIYSIDEAFIRLPAEGETALTGRGRLLRGKIDRWVGMPVSIGIAPTRTLAKIANRTAKKNPQHSGVFTLTEEKTDTALAGIRVGDIWGIGRRHAARLNLHNIVTALDLKNSNDEWIRKHLSVVGLRTVMELRGTPCISLDRAPAPRKSVISSRSFRKAVTHRHDLKEALSSYVSIAAAKLREEGLAAGTLQVFLLTSPHRQDLPQYAGSRTISLSGPTSSTPILIKAALQALRDAYKPGFAYQKAGVMLTELTAGPMRQQNLFEPPPRDDEAVMEALDRINGRWGRNTVQYASSGIAKPWSMSQDRKSPDYTTSWQELPIVKAGLRVR